MLSQFAHPDELVNKIIEERKRNILNEYLTDAQKKKLSKIEKRKYSYRESNW